MRTPRPGSPTAFELSLVGYWWVWWNLKVVHIRSLHTTHFSSLQTICCANSGKLKKVRETTSISPQMNEQLCLISKKIIVVPKTVDLLSLFPRNLTHRHWVNPVHKRSEGFSLSSAHCSRRTCSRRLELCGARLLAQLLHHVQEVFHLPVNSIYAWTDSMIVLSWLVGNPRRFKTYVGNRVSHIIELIPPDRWNHVKGTDNPADCASRDLFPSKLLDHELWWNGPTWLKSPPSGWPQQSTIPPAEPSDEVRWICHHAAADRDIPVIVFDWYSSFNHLKGITAWIFRYIENCHNREYRKGTSPHLTTEELVKAENYWTSLSQKDHFSLEMESLKNNSLPPESSPLFVLHPFVDADGLVRVGGRVRNAGSRMPPGIPSSSMGNIRSRSDYCPQGLLSSWLLYVINITSLVVVKPFDRLITRKCVTCRRTTVKPQSNHRTNC